MQWDLRRLGGREGLGCGQREPQFQDVGGQQKEGSSPPDKAMLEISVVSGIVQPWETPWSPPPHPPRVLLVPGSAEMEGAAPLWLSAPKYRIYGTPV